MKNRHAIALKAWDTRRIHGAFIKAHAAEAASKAALRAYCEERGWHILFFEGSTGAPRTGIIDAIAYRLGSKNPDHLDLRLVQLKGGEAGVNAREIARLKDAALNVKTDWLIAEFDGEVLQLLPDELERRPKRR
jgi:hypothetical protein